MIKQLKVLHQLMKNNLMDLFEKTLQSINLTEIGEFIMNQNELSSTDNLTMSEALEYILNIAQFIDNETSLGSAWSIYLVSFPQNFHYQRYLCINLSHS